MIVHTGVDDHVVSATKSTKSDKMGNICHPVDHPVEGLMKLVERDAQIFSVGATLPTVPTRLVEWI